MLNPKTDNNNYGPQGEDQQRNLAASGGPVSGLGQPDNKHSISRPYDSDIQTQLAAKNKSKKKRKTEKKN